MTEYQHSSLHEHGRSLYKIAGAIWPLAIFSGVVFGLMLPFLLHVDADTGIFVAIGGVAIGLILGGILATIVVNALQVAALCAMRTAEHDASPKETENIAAARLTLD